MSGLLGEKLGMSQVINEDGTVHPVTYVSISPNVITLIKTEEKDGYNAIVIGYKKLKKELKTKKFKHLKEFKVDDVSVYKIGDTLSLENFKEAEKTTVSGISKGKGFQGVMKRYGFHGGPKTHGSHHKRRPGSVGACAKPGRIKKGQKMPGRMGNDKTTLRDRSILSIDIENNIIGIKGALPGSYHSLITLKFS